MIAFCPRHRIMEAVEKLDGDLHWVCGHIVYANTPLDIPTGGQPHEHGKWDALDGVKPVESPLAGLRSLQAQKK